MTDVLLRNVDSELWEQLKGSLPRKVDIKDYISILIKNEIQRLDAGGDLYEIETSD